MFHFESPVKRNALAVMLILCLALWSMAFLETANARYISKRSGAVSVRVASFLVEAGTLTLLSPDEVIDCNVDGDTVAYGFTVRNRSEVTVRYEVTVEGLPVSISWDIDNASAILAPNGDEMQVELRLSALDPADRTQETGISGVTLTVNAVQVD